MDIVRFLRDIFVQLNREVSELMKRLETSTKDDMKLLIKKHKDKNELDRIKRELQQKMIGEAVAERQKVQTLNV